MKFSKVFAIAGVAALFIALIVGVIMEPERWFAHEASRKEGERLSQHRQPLTAILAKDRVKAIAHNPPNKPKAALEAFLKADTVDALLPLVADRHLTEAKIRRRYPDGKIQPVAFSSIESGSTNPIPDTDLHTSNYWVTVDRRRIPVMVDETDEGFEIDWLQFTHFFDSAFERFVHNPRSPSGQFYTQLRRSHYFRNDVPDLDELFVFHAQSPVTPYLDTYVFVRKDDPVGKEMAESYKWSENYRPVVELTWTTLRDGGDPRIEITGIVRHRWRH